MKIGVYESCKPHSADCIDGNEREGHRPEELDTEKYGEACIQTQDQVGGIKVATMLAK